MQEFETRVLNINIEEIVKKLEELGATKVFETLQKRCTYDFPGKRLLNEAREKGAEAWVRIRDDGFGSVKMAYKCHSNNKKLLPDCTEVEFEVPNMEMPEAFLFSIGMKKDQYVETKRIRYELDDLQFDIDTWPKLQPFLEIEGMSEARVLEGLIMLGFTTADTFQGHAGNVYEKEGFNDWKDWPEIKFDA
ncbi:MAG: hypothetical protein O2877_01745 [bacterium]|nr:hypothetical protein [bacterium]